MANTADPRISGSIVRRGGQLALTTLLFLACGKETPPSPPPAVPTAAPASEAPKPSPAELAAASTLTAGTPNAATATADYPADPTLPPEPAPGQLGGPRVGLTPAELAAFRAGRAEFWRTYDVSTGLGPHYNEAKCAACHADPVLGGSAGMDKAGRVVFEPPEFVEIWPIKAIEGFEPLQVPKGNIITFRRPPPLFGLGLLEAIPAQTITANCSRPPTADGVQYRANRAWNGQPGRLGSKAHNDTIVDFAASAMTSEMGVTNPLKRDPRFKADKDKVPDPEVPAERILSIATFVRLLAPPPRVGQDPEGEALFETVGCASCHMPTPHAVAPGAYTDLCLHKMGKALDSAQPDFQAAGDDWRTTPLWGLNLRKHFLHDDRADTLEQAITMHDGESRRIRDRFKALPAKDKAALLRFLRTL